ncbi:MAG: hypothetical protein AAF213_00755 [Pseudomonadota bacterium]
MFSRFFKPKPDALAYEIMGLVTGLKDVRRGTSNMLANQSAARLANKINRVLTDATITLDGATADYLKAAYTPLKKLGQMRSSRPTGEFHATRGGAVPVYRADPAWEQAYFKFRQGMAKPTHDFLARKMEPTKVSHGDALRQSIPSQRRPGG